MKEIRFDKDGKSFERVVAIPGYAVVGAWGDQRYLRVMETGLSYDEAMKLARSEGAQVIFFAEIHAPAMHVRTVRDKME